MSVSKLVVYAALYFIELQTSHPFAARSFTPHIIKALLVIIINMEQSEGVETEEAPESNKKIYFDSETSVVNVLSGIISVDASKGDSIHAINPDDENPPLSNVEHAEVLEKECEKGDKTEEQTDTMDATVVDTFWDYKLSNTDTFLKTAQSSIIGSDNSNCLKGCKWAPDGSCLLTNSDDNTLRIFNLPESFYSVSDWIANPHKLSMSAGTSTWGPALKIKEGGQIYDYCWYPLMNSSDPVSSCLLTAVSNAPVHLWDAFSGVLRASYCSFNQVDELVSPHCVAFDIAGQNIYCGFLNTLRIFDITRPGRECVTRKLKDASDYPGFKQNGIISSIAVNPTLPSLYAVGSYRSSVGMYNEDGSLMCVLEGHYGGITHLKFSHDGTKLYSGARKDNRLICWDMRNMGEAYSIYDRVVSTNQRIYFDVTKNDQYLMSGGTDGFLRTWDLTKGDQGGQCDFQFQGSSDCVNGVR